MQRLKIILDSFFSFIFILSFNLSGRDIDIQDQISHVSLGTIQSIYFGDQSFIPIEEFAGLLSIPTDKNTALKILTLHYKEHHIVFTAYSPFVRIDNFSYQMSSEVRYPNREFYIPINSFIDGIKAAKINTISFDESRHILYIMSRAANLVRISTLSQNDTLKLVLHATTPFRDNDITTIHQDEWFYLTVNGGVIDAKSNLGFAQIPEVFEIIPLQINRDQARLSLHLAPHVSGVKVECNEQSSEIEINLAITSVASSEALAGLQREREKWKIDRIIIDPGHGGKDPGCVGPGQIFEKNIVLNIARATKRELQSRMAIDVILTRDGDSFIPLKKRTKNANEAGGKLFISFHVDANRVKSLRGHTVYFLGPAKTDDARNVAQFENSVIQFEDSQNDYAGLSDMSFILAANAQNAYNKESQDFASMIDQEIKTQCGSKSHGVRQAGFYVLYGASMPNILIETGFMTNSTDRNNLISREYQNALAKAVADGIIKFKEKYERTTF